MKKSAITITSTIIIALALTACSATPQEARSTVTQAQAETISPQEEIISQSSPAEKIQINGTEVTAVNKCHGYTVFKRQYFTLAELLDPEQMVDLVVIGEFVGETRVGYRNHFHEGLEEDVIISTESFNQFLITEVLRGDVEVGDIITVAQTESFDEQSGVLSSSDNLTPMNKGDRWIYFLKYDNYVDAYFSAGFADGRYPLPDGQIMSVMRSWSREIDKIDEDLKNNNINKWSRMHHTAFEVTKEIETCALGVFDRNDFKFGIYLELLEYFQIEARDWQNPGRDFDAGLIEVYEKTLIAIQAQIDELIREQARH
jgi:hypothetical protein